MRGAGARFLGLLVLLGLIVFGVNSFNAETNSTNLRLYFFDVGQGDAIFMDTPNHFQVLVDGGPNNKVVSELSRVMPIGDTTLDLVVVSHNHADHIGGLTEVLRHYDVGEIWVSGAIHTTEGFREMLELIRDRGVKATVVTAGQTVSRDGLEGITLFPLTNQTGLTPDNQHDASVVTYWQYGEHSWLLTGDAEQEHEAQMLARALIKPITILKVGHHGSNTSTGEALLQATQPKYAVISLGANNRYGHPHQVTLDKLAKFNIPVLRTDQSGTIRFDFSPTDHTYRTAR